MDINANTYSDYLMVISPPVEVMEMIRKYKKSTANTIGSFDGMHGKAHISVATQPRQMPYVMGQKLDCYQRPINKLKPVTMHVNGFDYFKHGSTGVTIYAKIELSTEVNNWFKHIKKIFGENRKEMVPHITVARNISVEHFQKLWPKFIDKQYRYDFIPQSITVLTRPMIGGKGKFWTPVKDLYFNNFG